MPDYIQAFGLTVLRAFGAIFLFWTLSFFYENEKIEKKDFFRLALCGVFGVALNQLMFLKGLDYTNPIDASIIMTINPILVLIMASILINEKITFLKILGIIIGAAGAIILILYSGEISFSSHTFLGNIMMLINASSYAVYLVMVKPLMKKYKPITVIKWVFLFGSFIIIPVGFSEFNQIVWSEIPINIYLSILYLIIFTTFFAYLLNIYSLKNLNSSTVSIYIYSQPVLAAIVAIVLGKDSLSFIKVLSTILVFIGVFLVSKQQK